MLDTYEHLCTAVQTWAMRTGDTEFTANLPDMVRLAESTLNYGSADDTPPLRAADMEGRYLGTLTDGVISLPDDYLEYREVWYDDHPLRYGAPSELRLRYGTTAGTPRRFTIVGNQLQVYPASSDTIGLDYYAAIPALSTEAPTNWLLTKWPAVYLFGTLMQAAPYMMDDQRLVTWGTLYQRAVAALVGADRRYKYARAAVSANGPTP